VAIRRDSYKSPAEILDQQRTTRLL